MPLESVSRVRKGGNVKISHPCTWIKAPGSVVVRGTCGSSRAFTQVEFYSHILKCLGCEPRRQRYFYSS